MGVFDQVQVGETVRLRSDDGQYFAAFEVVESDTLSACPVDTCTVKEIDDDGDSSTEARHVGFLAVSDGSFELTQMDCSGGPMVGYWRPMPPSSETIAAVGQLLDNAWGHVVDWAQDAFASAAEAVGFTANGYDYYEAQISLLDRTYSKENYIEGDFANWSLDNLTSVETGLADLENEIRGDILLSDAERDALFSKLAIAQQTILLARIDAEGPETDQTGMADEQ